MNSLGFELHIAGEQTIEALHTGESGICSSHVIFWPRNFVGISFPVEGAAGANFYPPS